jgi:RNA polymerase sigma-70 factor (ECF subfamily)
VRQNDGNAFAEIYDMHRERVFGQALRLVRNSHDAEDITALVFLELWRRRQEVDPADKTVIGWLLVATNFVVRNFERTTRRHRDAMSKIPPPADSPDQAPAIDAALDAGPARSAIGKAFLRLSHHDQDILTLCVLEELNEAQVSAALGIARGTVKSRLSRAKARLAKIVRASGEPLVWEGIIQ